MMDQYEQRKIQSTGQPQKGYLYHSPQGSRIIMKKLIRIRGPEKLDQYPQIHDRAMSLMHLSYGRCGCLNMNLYKIRTNDNLAWK